MPVTEYRAICPYVLITLKGSHCHPIPLPHKTPPKIRREILNILETIVDDIPDLTPRRFIRHPGLNIHLKAQFPHLSLPSLVDLHISLANRSHIKSYITLVKDKIYPSGTSWEGKIALHLQ